MCSKIKEALKRTDLTSELRLVIEECLAEQNIKEEECNKKANLLEETISDLEKQNHEKDKFFSIIAHDLRGPLGTFMGLSELLMDDYETMALKDLRVLAGTLNTSAENIFQLLESLLEWSKTRTGKMKMDIGKISFDDSVSQIITLLDEAAKNKGVTLKVEISNLSVSFDRNMLESILRNLIGNAIKFCTTGDKIVVSAMAIEGFVKVSISDSGIGMSEEILVGLFKLGSNVQRQGTNNEPSTGLGLLLCKEFIELHGGKIWAQSRKGYGSEFYFTIPILPVEAKV